MGFQRGEKERERERERERGEREREEREREREVIEKPPWCLERDNDIDISPPPTSPPEQQVTHCGDEDNGSGRIKMSGDNKEERGGVLLVK